MLFITRLVGSWLSLPVVLKCYKHIYILTRYLRKYHYCAISRVRVTSSTIKNLTGGSTSDEAINEESLSMGTR